MLAFLVFLVSHALAGDSYVPPLPPPRVITYTEIRFETRYSVPNTVIGSWASTSAPASSSASPSRSYASGPPPESLETKCGKGNDEACHQVASNFHWDGNSAKALEMFAGLCDRGRAKSCAAASVTTKDPVKVGGFLQRACDGGYLDACGDLGFRLLDGVEGMPVDEPRAARLFERGCAAGSADGCIGVGWLHWLGKGGYAYDPAKAVAYGERACPQAKGAKPEACLERARFHEWAGDRKAAAEVRLDICYAPLIADAKTAEACRLVGPVLYHGTDGMKPDSLAAFAAYERACGIDGESCYWAAKLATLHPGYREPRELAESSCRREYGPGCTLLGDSLRDAPGSYTQSITEKYTEVRAAWRKGCDLGDPQACWRLGEGGTSTQELADLEKACVGGVSEACAKAEKNIADRARVATMFTRACEAGSASACTTTGDKHGRGDGVAASAEQAVAWFETGCMAGDRAGCVRVADAALDGRGTPRDPATAELGYTDNCDAGFGPACVALADAIDAGKLAAGNRDPAALRRKGCLAGVREACAAVAGGAGPTVEPGTRVTWFADETFTNGRHCKAVGPLLWDAGARWTGSLVCNTPATAVVGALLSVEEGWPLRSPVRVLWAEDPDTLEPWAGIGSLCRTGHQPGYVACMDGKDHFLAGDYVIEPVAPELVQLPSRKAVRKGKRVDIVASVPELEYPYLARCKAEGELVWRPDGWYDGPVRCENPDTVLERVILQPK